MAQYVEPHGAAWVAIVEIDRGGREVSPTLHEMDLDDGVLSHVDWDGTANRDAVQRVFDDWFERFPGRDVEFTRRYRATAWWQYSGLPVTALVCTVSSANGERGDERDGPVS